MIEKLKSKIFWIIMFSFSIVIISTVILVAVLNYKNTVSTATSIIDRMADFKENKPNNNFNINNNISNDINNRINNEMKIDGLYSITVENGKVIENDNSNASEELKNQAVKLATADLKSGIIGNNIYSVKKIKENKYVVILMENENAISQMKTIIILTIIAGVISLIIIYIIAKKIAILVVKPVKNTMEKQVQFISDASHELKTPLAVIRANSDVLEENLGENKWLKYIQNEVDSMNKLVNELLLLAKTENVKIDKKDEKINLSQEIELVVAMFESMAYEKNIKLENDIQEKIEIKAEKEDFEHILSTLLDNAIKHTEKGKNVKVKLRKEKGNIILKVENQGKEIPKEEREKIFERFYRVDKSRNRNEKRYGLGLSIAKSIVQKYNGQIKVGYKDGYTDFEVVISI